MQEVAKTTIAPLPYMHKINTVTTCHIPYVVKKCLDNALRCKEIVVFHY